MFDHLIRNETQSADPPLGRCDKRELLSQEFSTKP